MNSAGFFEVRAGAEKLAVSKAFSVPPLKLAGTPACRKTEAKRILCYDGGTEDGPGVQNSGRSSS